MAQPQIKIDELQYLIENEGLKNLDSFAMRGKISRIQVNLEALLKTNALSAFHCLGILCAYQSNYEQADNYFKKALALAPNDFLTLLNYAKVLEMLGLYEDTINICIKTLKLEPHDSVAFQRLNQFSDLYLFPEFVEKSHQLYKGKPIDEKFSREVTSSISTIDFLNKINLKVETYRTHLNIALKLFREVFNTHFLHTSTDKNFEYSYLSTVIYVPSTSVEMISSLNQMLDEKISMWLQSQPDGGFDLADELEGSIIYFSAEFHN